MAKKKAKTKAKPKSAMKKKSAAKSKPKAAVKAKPRQAAKRPAPAKPKAPATPKGPRAIPEGYHTATPFLHLQGAAEAIDFYKRAFGAVEVMRMPGPDGRIGHAEIRIGDSPFMLADLPPGLTGMVTPTDAGGATATFYLYVPNIDAFHARAVVAGAREDTPPTDQFYGDLRSQLTDPFGHIWFPATHTKDVTPEEMKKAMAAMNAAQGSQSSQAAQSPNSSDGSESSAPTEELSSV